MNSRIQLFKEYISNNCPNMFKYMDGPNGSGYFIHYEKNMEAQIMVSDSLYYSGIFLMITRYEKEDKIDELLRYFNKLNDEKYYCFTIKDSGEIVASMNYWYYNDSFYPEMVMELLKNMFNVISEKGIYDEIMRIIWS